MNIDLQLHCFGRAITDGRWITHPKPNIGNLYYVISGSAYYIHNGTTHKMIPGHMYLLPASLYIQRYYEPGEPFVHLFFDFITIPVIKLKTVLDIDVSLYPALRYTAEAASAFFFSIRDENGNFFCKPNSSTDSEILNLTENYFHSLIMLINRITALDTMYDKRIITAIQYIHSNYMNEISVQELANKVFLEKNYFIKLFKMCMNTTPHNYIRSHRLDRAISLLLNGKSIKETAFSCGFKSESAFSSAMRKVVGMAPSEFRK